MTTEDRPSGAHAAPVNEERLGRSVPSLLTGALVNNAGATERSPQLPRSVASKRGLLLRTALATALVAGVAFAAPASAADDAPQPSHTTVEVKNRKPFTNTGIALTSGETVAIRVTGAMQFGGAAADATTPDGVPWGPRCSTIANPRGTRARWPAPGERCWSLIARVGNEKPFEVGSSKTFRVDNDGTLHLGLNDNFVKDNHGHWTAVVTVTPAVPAE